MVNTSTELQLRQEDARSAEPLSAQSFPLLYETHRERLLNSMIAVVRNRDIAEDITATAFGVALQNLASFREESSFYTWLYRIALNEVFSLRRQQHPSLQSSRRLAVEPAECDKTDERLDRSECRARLRNALRRVPTVYRRLLVDHFVRGSSVKELARQERIPLGTVLSRIFTGKRILRRQWRQAG